MGLIRPSALLLALLMTSPALYRTFVTEDLDLTSALIRFVIAVPIAAVMLAGLRVVTNGYGDRDKRSGAPPTQPSNAEGEVPGRPG